MKYSFFFLIIIAFFYQVPFALATPKMHRIHAKKVAPNQLQQTDEDIVVAATNDSTTPSPTALPTVTADEPVTVTVTYISPVPIPTDAPASLPILQTAKPQSRISDTSSVPQEKITSIPSKEYPPSSLFSLKQTDYYPKDGIPEPQKDALFGASLFSLLLGSGFLHASKLLMLKEAIRKFGFALPYSIPS